MNKRIQKWLRAEFIKKHGRVPNKTKLEIVDGLWGIKAFTTVDESEWRRVKKHYQRTGEVL